MSEEIIHADYTLNMLGDPCPYPAMLSLIHISEPTRPY